jgi:hypothetical protein
MGGGETADLYAPIQLPAGAWITRVTAYVRDDADQDLHIVVFRKTNLNTNSNGTGIAFDTSGNSGYFSVSFDANSQITTDQAYFLRIRVLNGAWPTDGTLRISNISIEWTLDAP